MILFYRSVSPIRFTPLEKNLPVTVTILHSDNQRSITFRCSIDRSCSIACQLFHINHQFDKLIQDDCLLDDEDVTLPDIDSSMSEIHFQLILTASIYLSSEYKIQVRY